jgi:hypothetical protein
VQRGRSGGEEEKVKREYERGGERGGQQRGGKRDERERREEVRKRKWGIDKVRIQGMR